MKHMKFFMHVFNNCKISKVDEQKFNYLWKKILFKYYLRYIVAVHETPRINKSKNCLLSACDEQTNFTYFFICLFFHTFSSVTTRYTKFRKKLKKSENCVANVWEIIKKKQICQKSHLFKSLGSSCTVFSLLSGYKKETRLCYLHKRTNPGSTLEVLYRAHNPKLFPNPDSVDNTIWPF